jgi:hypothetical protein
MSFMNIGLVDPILPSLAGKPHAIQIQVELLFTNYLVVPAVMIWSLAGCRAASVPSEH